MFLCTIGTNSIPSVTYGRKQFVNPLPAVAAHRPKVDVLAQPKLQFLKALLPSADFGPLQPDLTKGNFNWWTSLKKAPPLRIEPEIFYLFVYFLVTLPLSQYGSKLINVLPDSTTMQWHTYIFWPFVVNLQHWQNGRVSFASLWSGNDCFVHSTQIETSIDVAPPGLGGV
jgi:hypothetical protein